MKSAANIRARRVLQFMWRIAPIGDWEPHVMLSRETLEEYRRMTPGQRLSLALRMTSENTPYLLAGSPELVARRFELLRRQNDERNRRMCEAMTQAERRHERRSGGGA